MIDVFDNALIEFYISEGISRKWAESLVKLSSRTDKLLKNLTIIPFKDEMSEDENETYGFEIYDTLIYPPFCTPPEERNKLNQFRSSNFISGHHDDQKGGSDHFRVSS